MRRRRRSLFGVARARPPQSPGVAAHPPRCPTTARPLGWGVAAIALPNLGTATATLDRETFATVRVDRGASSAVPSDRGVAATALPNMGTVVATPDRETVAAACLDRGDTAVVPPDQGATTTTPGSTIAHILGQLPSSHAPRWAPSLAHHGGA